jgi:hypothetical protein
MRRMESKRKTLLALGWVLLAIGAWVGAKGLEPAELLYLPAGAELAVEAAAPGETRGPAQIAALFAAGLVPSLAYLAVGLWIARGLRLGARGAERVALAWLLGTGGASLLLLGLRIAGIPVPLAGLGLVALCGIPALLPPPAGSTLHSEGEGRAPDLASRVLDAVLLAFGALVLLSALGPEVSWDGLAYHLPIARAFAEGPIRPLPGVLDAEFRLGIDLLFIPALAAGQPDAAAIVSAGFALALVALLRGEVARRASPAAGSWAGLLALGTPLVLDFAPTSYVDLGVGAYGFLALLASERFARAGDPRELALSALAAGFAANAKLHGALVAPAVLVILLLGGRRPSARQLLGWAAAVAAMASPWLFKAWLTTGNPFFPFLGDWLGTGATTAEHLRLRRERLRADLLLPSGARGLLAYLRILAFGSEPFAGGLLGPLPLAFAPLALGRLSRPSAALAAVCAAFFALQLAYAPALRFGAFWVPCLGIAAACGGLALARSGRAARAVVTLLCVGVAALQGLSALRAYAPRVAAIAAPQPYERAVWPSQENLARMVARGAPVVGILMGAVLWMPQPVYPLLWELNGEIFLQKDSPADVLEVLRRRGVRSLVFPGAMPLPPDGSVRHPMLDSWIRSGYARPRRDVETLPAWPGRVWVLIDLR